MMLESDKFDDIWENLSAVFNVSPEKPNWHEEERPEVESDDTHSLKQRMAAKDSAGYLDLGIQFAEAMNRLEQAQLKEDQ